MKSLNKNNVKHVKSQISYWEDKKRVSPLNNNATFHLYEKYPSPGYMDIEKLNECN